MKLPVPSLVEDPDKDLPGALHEVSNALTVVLGWLEAAKSRAISVETRDALEVAISHARLGRRISRRAIGADEALPDSEGRARHVAEEVVRAVQQEATRCRVRVALDCSDSEDLWLDSPEPVQQILINLLLNAIAFTPANGAVTLKLSGGLDAVFTVHDDGNGLTCEQANKVFDGGKSTRQGGAGIGLRHARSLAERHRGTLCCVPRDDGGCFELHWPARAPASSMSVRRSVGPLTGKRVLLIEDDPAVVSLIEIGLQAQGAQVCAVNTRAQLTEFMATAPKLDAALVDLSPIADDTQGAMALLKQSSPDLPVIVISGTCLGHVAFEAGSVARWVRKPFEISELVDALEQV